MILLYVLLGLMIATAATCGAMVIFGYQKNVTLRRVVAVGLATIVAIGVFCVILGGIYRDNVADLKEDYKILTLYQYTIEQSNNEYVRYDYYDRVTEYNDEYDRNQTASINKWLGWLYPEDWDYGIGYVEFALHGDEYYVSEG